MDLVGFLSPKHVILVHGEKPKMATLKGRIESELGIQCCYPANGETVLIPTAQWVKIHASKAFIRSHTNSNFHSLATDGVDLSHSGSTPISPTEGETVVEGVLMMEKTKRAKAVHKNELLESLSVLENKVQFAYCCPVYIRRLEEMTSNQLACSTSSTGAKIEDPWLTLLLVKLKEKIDCTSAELGSDLLTLESFQVRHCLKESCSHRVGEPADPKEPTVYFCCSWSLEDEKLAWRVLSVMRDSPPISSGIKLTFFQGDTALEN